MRDLMRFLINEYFLHFSRLSNSPEFPPITIVKKPSRRIVRHPLQEGDSDGTSRSYRQEADGDRERLQQGAGNSRTAAGDEHQRILRRAPHFGSMVFQDAAGRMGASGDARPRPAAD